MEKKTTKSKAAGAVKSRKEKTARERRITTKRDYIRRVLKKEGKWSSELSQQATLLACLLVRFEEMNAEITKDNYSPVITEVSREGNARMEINPVELLYYQCYDRCQRALKALGMNTDSKERKGEGKDGFADFLESMKGDE